MTLNAPKAFHRTLAIRLAVGLSLFFVLVASGTAQDKFSGFGLPSVGKDVGFDKDSGANGDDTGDETGDVQSGDVQSGGGGFDTGFGFGGFGGGFGGESSTFEASFEVSKSSEGPQKGRLHVKVTLADGYHIYSMTQPSGGPIATTIKLLSNDVTLAGPFTPDHDPKIHIDELSYPGLPLEEYYNGVTWTAAIEFPNKIAPESTEIQVQVDGQVCKSSCMPVGEKVTAKFAGYYGEVKKKESLRVVDTQAVWSATISPAVLKPGDTATLSLAAQVDKGYHLYQFLPEYEVDDGFVNTDFRTVIVAKTKSGLKFGAPVAKEKLEAVEGFEQAKFHVDSPTWNIPIKVPENAQPGELPIEIIVGFLTCNDRSCSPPSGISASTTLVVGATSESSSKKLALTTIAFATVEASPNLTDWIDDAAGTQLSASEGQDEEPAQALTLFHLLAGLAGGFILNFMPCVLPVIGLKLMSFVSQAGNSHRRVVSLNLAFVGGILAVMLLLALITVFAKVIWGTAFGWGEQFTVLEFKVVLAALVFAMALSFLGVWEIPIPGFATSSKSGELMEKEGIGGAFLKGILTTVLATPCSGPLLGSLFGLSLTLSSLNVILLYMVVGIGMSLPYLALCLHPGFIKLLPKPGAWMDTLKQVLAFPLLLTAVFFVASIDDGNRIATLILLIVVWFACWLIGRVPAYAESGRKFFAWTTGAATIALGAFISFSYFGPIESELPWVPYNEAQLVQLRKEGKTVMVDFTANWCVNCQVNTRIAIERERVAAIVKENDVVPMLADWTKPSDEIRNKLDELQSNSIPLMVIYPGDDTLEPILLRDVLSENQVVTALEEAGPSQAKTKLTSTIH